MTDAADAAENLQPRLHSVVLNERARRRRQAARSASSQLDGVRRGDRRAARGVALAAMPEPDFRFEAGDVVILLGRPVNLAIARSERLLEG